MEQKVFVAKARSFASKAFRVACGIGVLAVICSFFGLFDRLMAAILLMPVVLAVLYAFALCVVWAEYLLRRRR